MTFVASDYAIETSQQLLEPTFGLIFEPFYHMNTYRHVGKDTDNDKRLMNPSDTWANDSRFFTDG